VNADPDPALTVNADPDPDPALKMNADPCGSGSESMIYFNNKNFLEVKKMLNFNENK
jgi:hypothetical protein